MNNEELVSILEAAWDSPNGVLYLIRQGNFDQHACDAFLTVIDTIHLGEEPVVDRHLVSLLWMLPVFLEWQSERIAEGGGDTKAYTRFKAEVQNKLENIFGVP